MKVLSYVLTIIWGLVFFLLLGIFHPLQWIALKLFGYKGHKAVVDLLNLLLMKSLLILGSTVKYEGREELTTLLGSFTQVMESNRLEQHSIVHGVHEIVIDWTMHVTMKWPVKYSFSLPMHSHFLLEPPTKSTGESKIFRIFLSVSE